MLLNEKLLLPSDAPEPEPASPPAASDAPEPEPASPSVATLFYYPTTTANEEPDEHDIPSLAELAVDHPRAQDAREQGASPRTDITSTLLSEAFHITYYILI